MSNRRDFLARAVATGGVIALGAAGGVGARTRAPAKTLRLLFLGGTGFIGPHHVRAAVERGHKVAVFNRRQSQAELPTAVERLTGDRNGNLDAIRDRDWDAVIDLATYGPGWVRSLGEALRSRVGHYTFISAIAVYENPAATDTTSETGKLREYQGEADPYTVTLRTRDYGELKVLCEREADTQFPGKTLILRPCYIAGPGDFNGALTYLSVRARKGGEMLASGEPSAAIQYIDVRDMAAWAIRMIEQNATGIYNTTGPAEPTTCRQLIQGATAAASASARPTWVPADWLTEQNDSSEVWGQVLYWHSQTTTGLVRIDNKRALAAGLSTRSVRKTVTDVLTWYRSLPEEQQTKVVTGRKRKHDGSGSVPASATWVSYLEREQQVLAAWHARRAADSTQS